MIFFGLPREEKETEKMLMMKIMDILSIKLSIKRNIIISSVRRMYSNPAVSNCVPVLVTFDNIKDKEDILKLSHFKQFSGFSISEDLSKKAKQSKDQLNKFMMNIKKNNPAQKCVMQVDNLAVEGQTFKFDEEKGIVPEKEADKITKTFR